MSFLADLLPVWKSRWRARRRPADAAAERHTPRERRVLIGVTVFALAALVLAPLLLLLRDALSQGPLGLSMALAEPGAWRAVRNSLVLGAAALAVNVFSGAAAAWVLARHRFPGRSILIAFLDVPLALSPAAAAAVVALFFGRQGYLRWLVNGLDLQILFAWPGQFLALLFLTSPIVARQLLAALQSVPAAPDDASLGFRQAFRRMLSPRLRPALFHGAVLTFARGLGEFGALAFIGAGFAARGETAGVFLARALEERSPVAVAAVALSLAALYCLFTLAGKPLLRVRKS
jgi:sulfate transport system permease protein